MTTITEKLAEALRALADCREPFNPDKPDDWNPEAYRNARATLAEYEAQRYGARIPEEFARQTLADYDAEIKAGGVNYPFYAGAFSQLVRGVVE